MPQFSRRAIRKLQQDHRKLHAKNLVGASRRRGGSLLATRERWGHLLGNLAGEGGSVACQLLEGADGEYWDWSQNSAGEPIMVSSWPGQVATISSPNAAGELVIVRLKKMGPVWYVDMSGCQ